MPKTLNVQQIIKKGTLPQRMYLMANHMANDFVGKSPIMTEEETMQLANTFIAPRDKKLYSQFQSADIKIRNIIMMIQQLRLVSKDIVSKIHWLLSLDMAYKSFDLVLNEGLQLIDDPDMKEKLITRYTQSILPHAEIVPVGDGTIGIDYNKLENGKYSFQQLNEENIDFLTDNLKRIKTLITALREYMQANKYDKIEAYWEVLTALEMQVKYIGQDYPLIKELTGVDYPNYDRIGIDNNLLEEMTSRYL
jgi:hypothetical protein